MVAKVITANSFKATMEYLTKEGKEHEVIASQGVRDYDIKKTIADFTRQAQENNRIKTKVFHASFSFHAGDKDTINKRGGEIIEEYLSRLKEKGVRLDETQYIIVRHNDREHPHYHLVANMVKDDGKRLEIGNVGYKMTAISRAMEKQYKLTPGIRKEYQQEVVKQDYNIKKAIAAVNHPKPSKTIEHDVLKITGLNPDRKKGKGLEGPSL
jgi:hypothetical protein